MDFSNDSFEESGSSVFNISSLDMSSISEDSLEVSFSFSEDSLSMIDPILDESFSSENSLDQSFSNDSFMVIDSVSVAQGKKQLVFHLPEFFQPPCTSEKVTPIAAPALMRSQVIIQSLSFTGAFGAFPVKSVHVQRVTILSKVDSAGFTATDTSFSFMALGISPPATVAAFALEYNVNLMILSSRIFGSFQSKENRSQSVTNQSLVPKNTSRMSTNNNMVHHLHPKVFSTNSAGLLQRIDLDIQSPINTSKKDNNNIVIQNVRDVQINDQIEVLETSVKYACRKPKKSIFRRVARWFRKKTSALKCF